MGAGTSSNRTCTPPAEVLRSPLVSVCPRISTAGPRPDPNRVTISPGDAEPGAKLAALTIEVILGREDELIVNFEAVETIPPGFATVTSAVPLLATRFAETVALN